MPLTIRLAVFFDALLVLSFFLKFICPLDSGCFTDPLVKFFFRPLFFVGSRKWFVFSSTQEIFFLLIFWFVAGALLGLIIDAF
ncbi:MAG TPA: hypothetical protein VJJ27_01325, partial [Candidatus Paceibacterota bacterium]